MPFWKLPVQRQISMWASSNLPSEGYWGESGGGSWPRVAQVRLYWDSDALHWMPAGETEGVAKVCLLGVQM